MRFMVSLNSQQKDMTNHKKHTPRQELSNTGTRITRCKAAFHSHHHRLYNTPNSTPLLWQGTHFPASPSWHNTPAWNKWLVPTYATLQYDKIMQRTHGAAGQFADSYLEMLQQCTRHIPVRPSQQHSMYKQWTASVIYTCQSNVLIITSSHNNYNKYRSIIYKCDEVK